MLPRKLVPFLCGALLACVARAQHPNFVRDVQPILAANCKACHGGDKRSGGFTIRDYAEMLHGGRSGASIIPGNAAQSLLLQRVTGERGPAMPMGGAPLTAADISVIRSWIDDGARLNPDSAPAKAPWTPKLELTAPEIPASRLTRSSLPIDRLIARYFETHGGSVPAPVGDAAFARRAYLDVWGLLPSPADLNEFVKSADTNKRSKLVDRLLADNRNYAEHWISFWNDLLRNDGGDNYHGGRESITAWLSKALETNEPYDRFVTDLLNPAKRNSPEGFLLGVNWRGDINASQTPTMQAAQNSAQVFLGINLKCNSCHDSFISRWKLKDAYGLAAFFSDSPELELVRCDNPIGQYTDASFLYPELNPESLPLALSERRAIVAKLFTHPRNGRTPRTLVNRYWQRLLGRGIVAEVDDLDAEPWSPELLDWLASDFVAHGHDLKHLLRTIMTSQAYQMPAVRRAGNDAKEYVFQGPEFRRITAEEFIDAIGSTTGEWQVATEPGKKAGRYSRDWRINSTTLSRALGRPIRDQVFTERDCSATTLQSLELVNGSVLTNLIQRGAQRMQGQWKAPPANLWDSGKVSSGHLAVEIEVSGLKELHLVVADAGSYSPERVLPVWAAAMLEKNGEWVPLGGESAVQMKGAAYAGGMRMAVPSEKILDVRGYSRFRAVVGVEEKCLQSDISPAVRFFAFGEKPDWERLVQVGPETPVQALPLGSMELISRIWTQALGRDATPSERKLALKALAEPGGLADLLWSVFMLPEFQLIG